MKEMYIAFNRYTKEYIYYETKLQRNRKNLGREEKGLIKKLSRIMNKKRKSILHLVNIKKPLLKKFEDYFSRDSAFKISVIVE